MRTFIGHTGHCGHSPKRMQGSDLGLQRRIEIATGSHIRPIAYSAQEMVTEAVRERLDRLRHERDDRLADRLLVIGKDCVARLTVTNFRSEDRRP
jgi:hypothetical protein